MLLPWFIIATCYIMQRGKTVEAQGLKDRYHQTDYNVKFEIIEIVNVNHTYLRNCTAGLNWYNRTTRVINGHGTLIKDITKKFKLEVQVLKFLSNEYRFFPITLTLACQNVVKNTFGILELIKNYGNIPTNCSIPKGYYYIKNGIFDFSQLPPYIPTGRYKLEIKLYNDRDYTATLNVYGAVEEIKNLWK